MIKYFDVNDVRSIRGKLLLAKTQMDLKVDVEIIHMVSPILNWNGLIMHAREREVGDVVCAEQAIAKLVRHVSENLFLQTLEWNAVQERHIAKLVVGVYQYGNRIVRYGTALVYETTKPESSFCIPTP